MKMNLTAFLASVLLMSFAHAASQKKSTAPAMKIKASRSSLHFTVETAPSATPAPTPFPSVLKTEFKSDEINSCLKSLCGPLENLQSGVGTYFHRTKSPSAYGAELWDSEFSTDSRKILEAKKKSNILSIQATIKALNSGRKLNENQPARALPALMKGLVLVSPKIPTLLTTDSQLRYILNKEETQKFLATLSPLDAKVAGYVLDFYVNIILADSKVGTSKAPLKDRFSRLYPNLSLLEAQKADANSFLKEIPQLKRRLGEFLANKFIKPSNIEIFQQAAMGKDLSPADTEDYREAISSIGLLSIAFGDDERFNMLMSAPIDLQSSLEKYRASGKIQKDLTDALAIEPLKIAFEIDQYCKKQLTTSLDMNVSQFQLKRFQSVIQEVKQAASVVLETLAPGKLENLLASRTVQEIEFQQPQSNSEKIQLLRGVLAREKTSLSHNTIQSAETEDEIQLILMIAAMSEDMGGFNNDKNDLMKDSDIKKACEELATSTVSDYAVSSLGKISISWYSANYPEYGAGIVAHEIGHVLSSHLRRQQQSFFFANETFSKSLTCVANRNPFVLQPFSSLSKQQNSTWSEEDWADHFSSLVMNQLRKNRSALVTKEPMGCALISHYFGFSNEKLEPAKDDSHASGLLRTLMMAHDRGLSTPQCQPFLNSISDAGRSLKCE